MTSEAPDGKLELSSLSTGEEALLQSQNWSKKEGERGLSTETSLRGFVLIPLFLLRYYVTSILIFLNLKW